MAAPVQSGSSPAVPAVTSSSHASPKGLLRTITHAGHAIMAGGQASGAAASTVTHAVQKPIAHAVDTADMLDGLLQQDLACAEKRAQNFYAKHVAQTLLAKHTAQKTSTPKTSPHGSPAGSPGLSRRMLKLKGAGSSAAQVSGAAAADKPAAPVSGADAPATSMPAQANQK